MSEGSKERSPQQLAKSRRGSLAQVKMLTVDERAQEVAKINKALGIKAPKDTAALDAARAAYIRLLGSLGSNAEVKAEVTCFYEQLDQMQLRMLDPKPRKRPTTSSPSTYAR
jgi:alcohol dehydrogenase class IV